MRLPLRNRVDPFGDIRAVPARGLFTGNRGVIHDPDTKTLLRRRWSTRAWIVCSLHWKEVRREPMGCNGPGGRAGWTELFFLDEVTALAAGHRPCFYCRRDAARDFLRRYGQAFGIAAPKAPDLDVRLHAERWASARGQAARGTALDGRAIAALPDGAMVSAAGGTFAIHGDRLLPWSFGSYGPPAGIGEFARSEIRLITPKTTVEVLKAGYRPVWHPTAACP
jgi:hypothetical protein